MIDFSRSKTIERLSRPRSRIVQKVRDVCMGVVAQVCSVCRNWKAGWMGVFTAFAGLLYSTVSL